MAVVNNKRVLLVAAENGALPGGKVGGVGDVIANLPCALASRGLDPTVLIPGYGVMGALPGASRLSTLSIKFGGGVHQAELLQIPTADPRVRHLVIEHPLLAPQGPGKIYCDDESDRPYAADAGKFAFFAAATIEYLATADILPGTVHLHDWHTALIVALARFGPKRRLLRSVRLVYTIHNLAHQGIRPFHDDASSLESWFPDLCYRYSALADPRYTNCINFMAIGIRGADRVNTVSPAYAREIQQAGDTGLECDLQSVGRAGRLLGILNGCEYPDDPAPRPRWPTVRRSIIDQVERWATDNDTDDAGHQLVVQRLSKLSPKRPKTILTSVGRTVTQKVALFLQPVDESHCALEKILLQMGDEGIIIMLGSGERDLERRLWEIARAHENFLFLCGYSESLAESLYRIGDLFLMPSSFEPCGISQMLAMRAGQPCVVHAVGGLKDTVEHEITGFVFAGQNPHLQSSAFVSGVANALSLRSQSPSRWRILTRRAAQQRFSWGDAARRYELECYAE